MLRARLETSIVCVSVPRLVHWQPAKKLSPRSAGPGEGKPSEAGQMPKYVTAVGNEPMSREAVQYGSPTDLVKGVPIASSASPLRIRLANSNEVPRLPSTAPMSQAPPTARAGSPSSLANG